MPPLTSSILNVTENQNLEAFNWKLFQGKLYLAVCSLLNNSPLQFYFTEVFCSKNDIYLLQLTPSKCG